MNTIITHVTVFGKSHKLFDFSVQNVLSQHLLFYFLNSFKLVTFENIKQNLPILHLTIIGWE